MAHVLKLSEWQDAAGKWHCADVEDLGHGSSLWWHPARAMRIPLDSYVEILVNKFHVSHIEMLGDKVLYFYWDKQSDMRKFKNEVNRQARVNKYMI